MSPMSLRLYILLLSSTLTVKIVQVFGQTGNCPTEKDVISQRKCYTLFETNITWPEAKAACESLAMSLAEFENKKEASYVMQTLVEPSWIGVYDLDNEHTTYVWLSNNKVANIDYWSTSPTYYTNMCVIIKWENGSFADTIDCDEPHSYICMSPMQNNSASTTETSSITTASTTVTPSMTTISAMETPTITTTPTTVTPPITTVSTTETPPITTVSTTETPPITTVSTTERPPITTVSTTETPPITTVSTTKTPPITTVSTTETPPITTVSTTETPPITTVSTTERAFNTTSGTEAATYNQTTPVCHCSTSIKLEANLSVLIGLVFLISI